MPAGVAFSVVFSELKAKIKPTNGVRKIDIKKVLKPPIFLDFPINAATMLKVIHEKKMP
jgi:hypothetical protein